MDGEVKNKENEIQDPPKKNWRQMLSERNPDLNVEDDDAIFDYMSSQFKTFDDSERQRKELNDVLSTDEKAAGILYGLSSGMMDGKPFSLIEYLLKNYGDAISEAASTEEAIELAKKKEADDIKKAADEAKRKSEIEANIKKADEALTEAVKETNVDEANVAEMLKWLYGNDDTDGLIHRIVKSDLNKEDWMKLLYAYNRDTDLKKATEEGRRSARRPAATTMHRNMRKAPTDLGGSSARDVSDDIEAKDPTLQAYSRMKRRV